MLEESKADFAQHELPQPPVINAQVWENDPRYKRLLKSKSVRSARLELLSDEEKEVFHSYVRNRTNDMIEHGVSVRTANLLARATVPGGPYWVDPNVLSSSTDKELKELEQIGDGVVKQIRNYLSQRETKAGRKRGSWQRFE